MGKSDETTTPRRSTRSTRGSVKPVVDLTKAEVETLAAFKEADIKVDDDVVKEVTDEHEHEDEDDGSCYQLTEREIKSVNNAFDLNMPANGEELLGGENLKTAIRSLGFEPRAGELRKLMSKFANKNRKVNRDSFQRMMALKMSTTPGLNDKTQNDEISKVFNLLDLDRTGKITLENLASVAKDLNEDITEEELREMIAEADKDGDFQIDKEEFHEIMKKTSLY